jgi:uncharacterized protein (TIGR02217 family)
MTFPTYRLPPDIEKGAQGGPSFSTVIQESISGQEQRIRVWANCRAKYDIGYSILESDDPDGSYRAVVAMFYAHMGRLYPFRFKDWSDYQATDEVFGTGDGATTQFQLSKTYDPQQILLGTPGSLTYTREIYLLATTPVIKKNGVTQTVTTDYTISNTGLVTFTSAPAASPATSLTWTGEYDLPVRWDTDYLPIVMNESFLAQINSMPFREVIGSAELA